MILLRVTTKVSKTSVLVFHDVLIRRTMLKEVEAWTCVSGIGYSFLNKNQLLWSVLVVKNAC